MKLVFTSLLLLLSLHITSNISIAANDPLGNFCNEDTEITNSTSIDRLLAQLVSKASSSGYIATSIGQGQDKLYGLAQCRGDVSSKDCSDCLEDAAKQIGQRCPNRSDARIWYDYCFLRYSKEDFIGKLDTSFAIFYFNIENVTEAEDFNKKLGSLIDKIRSEAVAKNNEGIGKGETKLSPFVTVYALVQCTRDLSAIDCAQCLAIGVANFPKFCNNRKGCRALYSSCYLRYELYPFFFPLDPTNPSSSSSSLGTSVVMVHA